MSHLLKCYNTKLSLIAIALKSKQGTHTTQQNSTNCMLILRIFYDDQHSGINYQESALPINFHFPFVEVSKLNMNKEADKLLITIITEDVLHMYLRCTRELWKYLWTCTYYHRCIAVITRSLWPELTVFSYTLLSQEAQTCNFLCMVCDPVQATTLEDNVISSIAKRSPLTVWLT